MNYRGLILSLIGLLAVIAGIFFAVREIRRKGEEPQVEVVERTLKDCHFHLLEGVPSDAAAIFSFDGGPDAAYYLTDSTSVFPVLLSAGKGGLSPKFIKQATTFPMAVSLHDISGDLWPLFILDTALADSAQVASLQSRADTLKIKYSLLADRGLMVACASESLISASRRQLEEGFSVLDNHELLSLTAMLPFGNAVFLSHGSSSRLVRTLLTEEYIQYISFLTKLDSWTALSLPEKGVSTIDGLASSTTLMLYQRILTEMEPGTFKFKELFPPDALSVMALSTDNFKRYFFMRRKWMDANGKLSAYKDANASARKMLGKHAEQYALDNDLKEVASALLPSGERLVALRYDSKLPGEGDVAPYTAGYALSMLFGDMFRPQGDTLWTVSRGNWRLVGSRSGLAAVGSKTLSDVATAKSLIPDHGAFVLYNAGNDLQQVLASNLVPPVRKMLRAPSAVSSVLWAEVGEEGELHYHIDYKSVQNAPVRRIVREEQVAKTPAREEAAPAASITQYPVTDYLSGKKLSLCQAQDGALSLRDAQNKVRWKVPFSAPVCSRVQEIDLYGNQKIQFLFAAGSRLYVIDRNGNFIPSVTTDFGKEILVGPDLYSFSPDEYVVLVLFKDRTIGLFTLEGARYPGWKDIKTDAASDLPVLIEIDGDRYWKLSQLTGDVLYKFKGGTPLSASKTRKLLKRITN